MGDTFDYKKKISSGTYDYKGKLETAKQSLQRAIDASGKSNTLDIIKGHLGDIERSTPDIERSTPVEVKGSTPSQKIPIDDFVIDDIDKLRKAINALPEKKAIEPVSPNPGIDTSRMPNSIMENPSTPQVPNIVDSKTMITELDKLLDPYKTENKFTKNQAFDTQGFDTDKYVNEMNNRGLIKNPDSQLKPMNKLGYFVNHDGSVGLLEVDKNDPKKTTFDNRPLKIVAEDATTYYHLRDDGTVKGINKFNVVLDKAPTSEEIPKILENAELQRRQYSEGKFNEKNPVDKFFTKATNIGFMGDYEDPTIGRAGDIAAGIVGTGLSFMTPTGGGESLAGATQRSGQMGQQISQKVLPKIVEKLPRAVQNLINSKVGSKIIERTVRGAAEGVPYSIMQGIEQKPEEFGKQFALDTAIGIGLENLFGVVGDGIGKVINDRAFKKAFQTETENFARELTQLYDVANSTPDIDTKIKLYDKGIHKINEVIDELNLIEKPNKDIIKTKELLERGKSNFLKELDGLKNKQIPFKNEADDVIRDNVLKLPEPGAKTDIQVAVSEVKNPIRQTIDQQLVGRLENSSSVSMATNTARALEVNTESKPIGKQTLPMQERTFNNVGDKKVNAYQFDNPQVQNEIQAYASYVKNNELLSGPGKTQETSQVMQMLKKATKASYSDIDKALNNIIKNEGAENYAVAKRVEMVIDDMLTNGFKTVSGEEWPADKSYLAKKSNIEGTEIKPTSNYVKANDMPVPEIKDIKVSKDATVEDVKGMIKDLNKKRFELQGELERLEKMQPTPQNITQMEKVAGQMYQLDLQLFAESRKTIPKEKLEKIRAGYKKNMEATRYIYNEKLSALKSGNKAKIKAFEDKYKKKISDIKYENTWEKLLNKKDFKDELDAVDYNYKEKIKELKLKKKDKVKAVEDKYKKKISGVKYKNTFEKLLYRKETEEATRKKLSQQKETLTKRFEAKEEKQKAERLESQERKKAKSEERKIENKILDDLKKVSKNLKYMRPEYKTNIEAILSNFDTSSKSMTKRKISQLKKLKEYIEENPEHNIPDYVLKDLDRLDKKHVSDMTLEEFQSIHKAVMHLVHLEKMKNKLIFGNKYKDFSATVDEAVQNIMTHKKVGDDDILDITSPVNQSGRLKDFYYNHLQPETLTIMADNMKDGIIKKVLFDEIYQGHNQQLRYKQDAYKIFKPFLEGLGSELREWSKHFNKKLKEKDLITFTTSLGRKIKMTKADRIYIHLAAKDKDALRSMINGGVSSKYNENVVIKLTPQDLENISKELTPEEQEFAQLAEEYFLDFARDKMNEVFLDLNGYELIPEKKGYIPITRHGDYIKRDILKPKNPNFNQTIEGMGYLKERVKVSSPIMIDDIFRVVIDHIEKISSYYGLAKPMRNAKMVMNNLDFKNAFRKVGKYDIYRKLDKYIQDIEVDTTNLDYLEKVAYSLHNRIAQSYLGFNPGTILKQFTSYQLIVNEISPKYLIKAQSMKTPKKDILEYSPILAERIEGNISLELGEIGKIARLRKMFGNYKDIGELSTKGLILADRKIIFDTWNAVKAELQEKFPEISDEELLEKTARRAEEITRHTNSSSTIFDRSEIGRSKSFFTKSIIMFTTQLNTMLNSGVRAALEYQQSEKTFKDFVKMAGAITSIFVINSILEELINTTMNRLRGKDSSYGMGDLISSAIKGVTNKIYGVGTIVNILELRLEYGKYNDIRFEASVEQVVNDLINLASDIINTGEQIASGEKYKSGVNKNKPKYKTTARRALNELVTTSARLKGISVDNIKKIFEILENLFGEKRQK